MTEIEEVKQDWYFTFGYGHDPGIGYYAVFHGTYGSAREEMIQRWGKKWAFQYGSAEKAGVKRFKLKEAK